MTNLRWHITQSVLLKATSDGHTFIVSEPASAPDGYNFQLTILNDERVVILSDHYETKVQAVEAAQYAYDELFAAEGGAA